MSHSISLPSSPRLCVCTLIIALILVPTSPASAWEGHALITRAALRHVPWLDQHPPVTVTAWADVLPGLHPSYHFAPVGEVVGQTVSARSVLERYSDEPDWGMDQNLNASWQQKFMGGYTGLSSQAYFHMYYPPWSVHLPLPGIPMGAAPKRLALFEQAARAAFARGDTYWGFRYAANALHYVQDVAQPFHATQTSIYFVSLQHPIEGTTKITGNYHFAYEGWVSARLRAGTGSDFGLRAALSGDDAVTLVNSPGPVEEVARLAHQHSARLLKACLAFFDRRFKQPVDVPVTPADLAQMEPKAYRDRILAATRPALQLTGQAIRGFVERLRATALTESRRRQHFESLEASAR